jgi:hypothetical protein
MGAQSIFTTVVTPASSYSLVALADFKNEYGITETEDDAYITRLVASASAAAAQYCNRVFVAETVLDEFWAQRDPFPRLIRGGFTPLQLTRWPVISIDTVTENAVALTEDVDFKVSYQTGQITRLDDYGNPRTWANRAIAIQYESGYATIPADLADAVLRMMRLRWFARDRDAMLRSESVVGAYDAQYWFANGPGSQGQFTPDIADILNNYRSPVVA